MSYFLCCQENVIHSDIKRRGYAERDMKERKEERRTCGEQKEREKKIRKEIDEIDKSFKLCFKCDNINVMYIMAGIRENELLVAGTW
jgi:hypothetical protein